MNTPESSLRGVEAPGAPAATAAFVGKPLSIQSTAAPAGIQLRGAPVCGFHQWVMLPWGNQGGYCPAAPRVPVSWRKTQRGVLPQMAMSLTLLYTDPTLRDKEPPRCALPLMGRCLGNASPPPRRPPLVPPGGQQGHKRSAPQIHQQPFHPEQRDGMRS